MPHSFGINRHSADVSVLIQNIAKARAARASMQTFIFSTRATLWGHAVRSFLIKGDYSSRFTCTPLH